MRRTLGSLLAIGAFALTACMPATDTQPVGTAVVGVDRAVALLDGICGASRPNFAGAEARMQTNGLTVKRNDRFYSPTSAASATVDMLSDGRKVCSVRATHTGDLVKLQDDLAAKYGRPNFRDSAGPGLLTYKRGSRGNMVLLIQGARTAQGVTTFDLGLIEGF